MVKVYMREILGGSARRPLRERINMLAVARTAKVSIATVSRTINEPLCSACWNEMSMLWRL